MSVIRVNKTKDYTVMSNYHFKDKRLSLKAKGLLSEMLSLPDDWDYTVDGLCVINKENKTSIQGALKELEANGYLIRTRVQDNLGRFAYQYDIYENPLPILPQTEKPFTDNLCTENPCAENQPQLNTNHKTTKRLNTNELLLTYTDDPELLEALKDFDKMRKTIKKPISTERAWKLLFTKLNDLAVDNASKVMLLNQSIEHNWQTVYPIKTDTKKGEDRYGWIDNIDWSDVNECTGV